MTEGSAVPPIARFLPLMPTDGPVNPEDYPEGIEWEEPEIDQHTGEVFYTRRVITAHEWNRDHAMGAKEAEAFKALQRAEAAKPFRFVEPERLLPAFARGRTEMVSGIVGEMTRQRGIELEALMDKSARRNPLTTHERKQLRWAMRLLLVELAVTREEVVALRQRLAELEVELKAARSDSAVAVQGQRGAADGGVAGWPEARQRLPQPDCGISKRDFVTTS